PLDWPQCVHDFTPDHITKFADGRSFTPEFVACLHVRQLIGLFHDRLAFPVSNASGAVVRAHVRKVNPLPDGSESISWFYAPKGPSDPFIIGDPRTASIVWG